MGTPGLRGSARGTAAARGHAQEAAAELRQPLAAWQELARGRLRVPQHLATVSVLVWSLIDEDEGCRIKMVEDDLKHLVAGNKDNSRSFRTAPSAIRLWERFSISTALSWSREMLGLCVVSAECHSKARLFVRYESAQSCCHTRGVQAGTASCRRSLI